MNRTLMTATMAGVILLGLGATAQAATISYVGLDETTNADWGSTSVAKEFDADNWYGTDGFQIQNTASASTYATIAHVGASWDWGYGPGIDDPANGTFPPGSATIPDINVGKAWGVSAGAAGTWSDCWTVTLTDDASFGITLFVDHWYNGAGYGPDSARVYLQSAPETKVAATDALNNDYDEDYALWNVTGVAGDVFVVEVQRGSTGYGHTTGLALDPTYVVVPEPATMSLVALGAAAGLVRRRRR